ncbi:MAG: hypothetical protein HYU36_16680 [Planctomycetes bacterium]|nr:hypothetical protein [Planctomycetota bacterium]
MRRLSLYHCIILAVVTLWASLFVLSVLTVRHVQVLEESSLQSLRAHADITSRILDFQENLVKLDHLLSQESAEVVEKQSLEGIAASLNALEKQTHEMELLLGQVEGTDPKALRAEGYARVLRTHLDRIDETLPERWTSRSSRPSLPVGWRSQVQNSITGLFKTAQELNVHCRRQIQRQQKGTSEAAEGHWRWFCLMSATTLLLGLLVGLLIARRFANPVYALARQINEAIEPQRRVDLKWSHPIDSLRASAKSLVEELQILRGEVETSREKVAQSERLAVTGRVAVGLVQEIQKPLAAAKNALRSAASQAGSPPSQDAQRMLREVERVEAFLSQFLDFTGAQKPRFILLDVNGVMRKALELLSAECHQRKVAIESEWGTFANVLGDPALLQEALVNVILNALEAMPNGGRLSITTRLSLAGPPPLSDTQGVEVFLADTGPGFPPESLDRVFEPFYTTKAKGTGMGLAIVKRILEQHGGRVRVLNREGGGAIVSLFLPLPSTEQRESLEKLEQALVPKPLPVSTGLEQESSPAPEAPSPRID